MKMLQQIKNLYHLVEAVLANIVYGFPSRRLQVLAITGTDGKTTTTTLLYQILKKAGYNVALISTVAAFVGDEAIDTGFHVTTPSPFALQKLLAAIVSKKIEYVVLEVTSHGIDQNRIWGVTPLASAITNVTHEHLDYHGTFEAYAHTKAQLLLSSGTAFLNRDATASFHLLESILQKHGKTAQVVSSATLQKKISQAVRKRFGDQAYNFENAGIATALAMHVGVKEKFIANAIYTFPGVPGRMEVVSEARGIQAIVDFAHTPNALENVLLSLKQQMQKKKKSGRLIVVFGCAGLRDHTKRPLMGEIATRIADRVVLTAEDPRTEDVWTIIAQIKSGVQQGHEKIVSIPDRAKAIAFALRELAAAGDTVIITGKGHEQSMCFGTTEYPWSDRDAIAQVVEKT